MKGMTSKKGFISLFWVAIIMLVTTAIMIVATNIFSNFAALPNSLLTAPFQGYYNAEFGMWYGKAMLDSGITPTPSITRNVPVVAGRNTVPLTVTIALAGTNDYTIVSTENPPAGSRPPVTVRARWSSTQRVLYQID